MLLLFISFIAGILTILAPCILPLLPVIVGGSLGDGKVNKKKTFTIVFSLGISIIAFTLLLKASSLFINIPEYTWTIISGGIILIFGLVTLFPSLWENRFFAKLSTKSNMAVGEGIQKKSFWGDVIVGAALGPVFSSCSPTYFIVLATVLPANPVLGILYLLAYTVGLSISLFVVAWAGQKILAKLNIAANPRGIFKKVLGILFILVGIFILAGWDKKIESDIIGSGFFDVTQIEHKLLEENNMSGTENTGVPESGDMMNDKLPTNQIDENMKNTNLKQNMTFLTEKEKAAKYRKAPEISTPDGFINTNGKPITLASLRGKVVLLDIWTYSCINCQRTLPYLNEWYEKYKDQGLEIVGLHTPEFSFEKVLSNVEEAVKNFGIKYPVVLDNNYSTWQELGNQYWPRKYLIDMDGYIIYDHIGEGGYDETEKEIQKALEERAYRMNIPDKVSTDISTPTNVISVDTSKVGSPEVYFGSNRNSYLANGQSGFSGTQDLALPTDFSSNKLYLGGKWNFVSEYAESQNSGSIVFRYSAKNVYMVASSEKGIEVEIYQDGKPVKKITIKDEKLYHLIDDENYGEHLLEIKIPSAGLKAFTFTFG